MRSDEAECGGSGAPNRPQCVTGGLHEHPRTGVTVPATHTRTMQGQQNDHRERSLEASAAIGRRTTEEVRSETRASILKDYRCVKGTESSMDNKVNFETYDN